MGSVCAILLAILLFFAKPEADSSALVANELGANKKPFTLKTIFLLFKDRNLWFLSLFVVGVSCTYDVFDQQFANFFVGFLIRLIKEYGSSVM